MDQAAVLRELKVNLGLPWTAIGKKLGLTKQRVLGLVCFFDLPDEIEIGAFITLEEPTRPMIEEAVSAGFYEPEFLHGKKYPRVQILTIEELIEDKNLKYPRILPEATFKSAKRKIDRGEQGELI